MKTKRWRFRSRFSRYSKNRAANFERYRMQLELPLNYSVAFQTKNQSDRDEWE